MSEHIHDCTGSDMRCPCGYVFRVPPISISLEVFDGHKAIVEDHFNCENVRMVVAALRRAADRLERR